MIDDFYAGLDEAGHLAGRLAELILMIVLFPIWFPIAVFGRYFRK